MLEINEALEQELANQKSLNLDSQGIMQKMQSEVKTLQHNEQEVISMLRGRQHLYQDIKLKAEQILNK